MRRLVYIGSEGHNVYACSASTSDINSMFAFSAATGQQLSIPFTTAEIPR